MPIYANPCSPRPNDSFPEAYVLDVFLNVLPSRPDEGVNEMWADESDIFASPEKV